VWRSNSAQAELEKDPALLGFRMDGEKWFNGWFDLKSLPIMGKNGYFHFFKKLYAYLYI
jgi:hypothetical protein